MENVEDNKKSAHQAAALHIVLLGLAYDQTLKGNTPTSTFNKTGWKIIIGEAFRTTGINYDKTQIKNE